MIDPTDHPDGIRVLVVEDHPVVRFGIRTILELHGGYKVTAEADSAGAAMKAVEADVPDLAIFDLSLKEGDGLELIKNLRALDYEFPILVMSMHDEELYAERVLKGGGNGYIMKQELSDQLIHALDRLCQGRIHVSDAMREAFTERAAGLRKHRGGIDALSDRELEVFRMLGEGKSTRQIAEILHLSVKTIETYRAHIKTKLGLANAAELVTTAAKWVDQL